VHREAAKRSNSCADQGASTADSEVWDGYEEDRWPGRSDGLITPNKPGLWCFEQNTGILRFAQNDDSWCGGAGGKNGEIFLPGWVISGDSAHEMQ